MQFTVDKWNKAPHVADTVPPRFAKREKIEPARDPIAVIRLLLAKGPVRANVFREQCHREGVSLHDIYKLARAAGARCRKAGSVGSGSVGSGFWLWELRPPENFGIIQRPGRRG